MANPHIIYEQLKKTKPKQLDKLELAHSTDKTRFSRFIAQLVDQVNDDETEYSKIMQRSKKAASESNVELAVVHALRAKVVRHEILARRSSLILMRANEFYHSVMIRMIRNAKLGIEMSADKLSQMLPPELRDVLLESVKGMDTTGMLEPAVEEVSKAGEQND